MVWLSSWKLLAAKLAPVGRGHPDLWVEIYIIINSHQYSLHLNSHHLLAIILWLLYSFGCLIVSFWESIGEVMVTPDMFGVYYARKQPPGMSRTSLRNRHNILVNFENFDFLLQKSQIISDIDLRASFNLRANSSRSGDFFLFRLIAAIFWDFSA